MLNVLFPLLRRLHLYPQSPSPAPAAHLLAAVRSLSSFELTQLGVDNWSPWDLVIYQRFPGQSGDFLPLIDQSVGVRGQKLFPWHGQQFSLQLVPQQGFEQLKCNLEM